MLKRLCLAFAGLFALISVAQGAGTIPGFSLTPQFDLSGKIAPGCLLYIIQAGTVSTPQNDYQDTALTQVLPNPLTCDAGGRLPQWFVADGTIKLRLTDKNGNQLFVGDNLLVIGPSSGGGGGGGTIDPTTIAATGDVKVAYGTSVLSGWVRANGRTIGSATSGATERANLDTQALFQYLWGADANLTVSGGRGASAAADWAANKTITLPDLRGRTIAGLDDMGSSAAGRLTASYFAQGCAGVSNATTLGVACGSENRTILATNLPPYTPAGTISTIMNGGVGQLVQGGTSGLVNIGGSGSGGTLVGPGAVSTFTGTAAPGQNSTPFANVQPTMLATYYLKL